MMAASRNSSIRARNLAERIATLEQQQIDITESLKELRRGIVDIDGKLAVQQPQAAE